jgi:hypothetical protein
MYLGTTGLSTASMAGVIKEFWPNPSGGVDDQWEIGSAAGGNTLDASHYAVDAMVSGEGLIVTLWVE